MASDDDDGGGHIARRGRPPLCPVAREKLILDALETVVAAKGLQAASMAAVARAAGMSKRTLYALHENRDALFEAWVRRLRASLVRPLPPEARALPLPERLRILLRLEAQSGTADPRLMVLRAVVAEAPRNPSLARAFFREGPQAVRAILRGELERAVRAGEIVLDDVGKATVLLCDMAYPSLLDKLLDPDAVPVSEEVADARLDLAIRVFLNGVRPQPAG